MDTRRAQHHLFQPSPLYSPHPSPDTPPLSLKRRRDAESPPRPPMPLSQCTLGGHLDSPYHLRSVLGPMISDPQLNSLCDVVIIVQGQRFPAHRAVLASVSRVFKAMFLNSMKERDAEEVVLSALHPRAWKLALHYIYHAQLDIQDEYTALLLLTTSRMYQLERLELFVEKFLVSCVSITNCLRLLQEAQRFDLSLLEKACYVAMEDNFEQLALSPAFTKCPYQVLVNLLPSDNLMVKSEIFLFESIVRWIKACEAERMEFLDQLLAMVHLDRLSDMEVRYAAREPLAVNNTKFKQRAFERLLHSKDDIPKQLILASGYHLKPRRRNGLIFTFVHLQRGLAKLSSVEDEEIVRTPWAEQDDCKYLWRLKIYPRGYYSAKGLFLSMYVQGRSACVSGKLDVSAKFDIFLLNRKDHALSISYSSQHDFSESSDHWGFHRFLELPQLLNPANGFLDAETDSVLLGANVYL